jgi:hypothetical protein
VLPITYCDLVAASRFPSVPLVIVGPPSWALVDGSSRVGSIADGYLRRVIAGGDPDPDRGRADRVDTTVERRLLAQLNEREIIDLAGELIRIPSFSPDETPVARFLATYFEQRGYDVDLQEVEPDRFQTIATLRGTGGGPRLMFQERGPDGSYILIDEMVQAARVLALTAVDFCGVHD